MSSALDSPLADLQRTIADLQRQLAESRRQLDERTAELNEAQAREAAITEVLGSSIRRPAISPPCSK